MIVCKGCEKILDNTAGQTEYKLCIDCVRDEHPAADLKKIIDQNGKVLKNLNGQMDRFKTMELRFEYQDIEGEIRVLFEILDYFKKPFFGFALTKEQLLDFVKDIETLEKQEEE